MPIEWTGLGPELLLRLDRDRREPLGFQLQQELREAIRSGRLCEGNGSPRRGHWPTSSASPADS